MRLAILLTICSLVVGCAVPRPKANICILNAKDRELICYNLHDDYDKDGKIKEDAKPLIIPIESLMELDKYTCTDPESFQKIKVWLRRLKDKYEDKNDQMVKESFQENFL